MQLFYLFYLLFIILKHLPLLRYKPLIKELYMSFYLAHKSKKSNYKELFSVAQCAKNKYFFLYI